MTFSPKWEPKRTAERNARPTPRHPVLLGRGAPFFSVCLLSFVGVVGCVTGGGGRKSSTNPTAVATPNADPLERGTFYNLLTQLGGAPESPYPPASGQKLDPKIVKSIQEQMETMLGGALSAQDKETLLQQARIVGASNALLQKRFTEASQTAQNALQNATTQSVAMARFALSVVSISDLQEKGMLSGDASGRSKNWNYDDFQNQLCRLLCSTEGWKTLSDEDPKAFQPQSFLQKFLSQNEFSLARLNQPAWLRDWGKENATGNSSSEKAESQEKGLGTSKTLQMKALLNARKISTAAEIAKNISRVKPLEQCDPDYTFAQYILARYFRENLNRYMFYVTQQILVTELDGHNCLPAAFDMSEDQFSAFYADVSLWLSRLHWENSRLNFALEEAKKSLAIAEKYQHEDLIFEAVQVLVGRIGFEMMTPKENLEILSRYENLPFVKDNPEYISWFAMRHGLFAFLSSQFEEAAQKFQTVIDLPYGESSTRANAAYWLGRSLKALGQDSQAQSAFGRAGRLDPLSFSDILSGQMLAEPSGHASSSLETPFARPWELERDSWINFKPSESFALFRMFRSNRNTLSASEVRFQTSLRSAVLLTALLRASGRFRSLEEFQGYLKSSPHPAVRLLHAEIAWLRGVIPERLTRSEVYRSGAGQVAWLSHVEGDHLNAVKYVTAIKDRVDLSDPSQTYLYFIFYPRPWSAEFEAASKTCSVDVDLLYALARQESLFNPDAQSGAGAKGMLQLLPSTAQRILDKLPEYSSGKPINLLDIKTNLTAGACYMRELLDRYDNNLTFAVAAYNAGEQFVDKWVSNRMPLKDIPIFIEFIPIAETKRYTQLVLRNFYNMKWIYLR